MATRIKSIFFAGLILASIPSYANEGNSWSMAPAKAVIVTFFTSMALIGKPDVGTVMYRYLMLSPMAAITATTATVAWNAITHPAWLEYLKSSALDVTLVPL